jgi:hypothetical protein
VSAQVVTTKFINFEGSKQLIAYSEDLFERKLHHLKNDVEDCLLINSKTRNAPAPYPAMLFSFSVIDMLGSLYTGSPRSNDRCFEYMTKMMAIEPKKAALLLQIHQSKLVHFADPNTVIEFRGSKIVWNYFHESDRSRHLQLKSNKSEMHFPLTPTTFQAEEEFSLGIADFAQDIRNSVYKKPSGYLELLKNSKDLQAKFDRALSELLCFRAI